MAEGEVKSSDEAGEYWKSRTFPDIVMDENEENAKNYSESIYSPVEGIGSDDKIQWHYLTFETILPNPAYLAQPTTSDRAKQPPECPDLKKYTNPFLWPRSRKLFMSWLGCIATTITAYTAGSYAAGIDQMTKEWHVSRPAAEVGITLFTCGFAVAPMFLAPFSEINGRRPMFVITGFLFVIFQLTCALTPTFAGMMVARFLTGCSSSTFSTMVGGVIADFYEAKDRNWAMALFAGGAIFGTGLGPVVSGFIAQHSTWRWIFRLQVITCGSLLVLIYFFFRESRGSVLLSRKAKTLNMWYEQLESAGNYGVMMSSRSTQSSVSTQNGWRKTPQRIRWKVTSDEERASIGKMVSVSLYRPLHLLFTEPVVFFFSLWISFAWSCLYLLFSAVPLVFETRYGFNIAQSGAVFAAVSIASAISTLISIYQEPLARKYVSEKRQAFLSTPEGRLFFCCVQSALLPIGCFWFGWTCFSSVSWIIPAIGIGCATMGIFSIYLAVFNYLADIYGQYASSALAAQSCCRNLIGGSFPIYTEAMFRDLTYAGAGSLLGGLSALLTVVPWTLVFYGPRIRARSKIARELVEKTDTS